MGFGNSGVGQGGHESELKQLATELGLEWTDIRRAENRKQKDRNHRSARKAQRR